MEWLAEHGSRRKATINDVARLAGVSKKTVSRVINRSPLVREGTRADVNTIIETLGYVPNPQARGLAFRHSFLIGMIYDNPNPQYVVNMQQGILDGLRGSGYDLVVHPCDRNNPDFVREARTFIEHQKLFGVILTPSVSEDTRLARELLDIGCAYVRIASVALDSDDHMLVSHDRLGAIEAARHLCELGHRKVGFIAGREGFRSSVERRAGFEAGLAEFGLELDDAFVAAGDYTFQSGVEAGLELLSRSPRSTAIFAANDEMAAGVMQALRQLGLRAPDAVSVVGYDDFEIAITVWPRLTSIHSPTREIGLRAAHRVLSLDGEEVQADAVTPWIVVRESTGPPPAD
ncbi:MAG: LacI family DNA-binding transcriptional regulator [Pseudomonadota bacterium]